MEKKFKPFDKVLVRIRIDAPLIWTCTFYSHLDKDGCHVTIGGQIFDDKDILPYEGNEHLVGTIDEPDEKIIELWEGDWLMVCDSVKDYPGEWLLRSFMYLQDDKIMVQSVRFAYGDVTPYKFAIRFRDFNPDNMDESLKHVICAKGEKIVNYRNNN